MKQRIFFIALAIMSGLVATSSHAAGVLSGTAINNRAIINFQVGGTPQEPVESSPNGNSVPGLGNGSDTTFVVDNRVDLVVAEADGAYTIVSPGQAVAVMSYVVTNTGNTTQDYALTATASATDPWGGTVSFSLAVILVFVDSNGNGTYEPLVDLATFIDELEPDESRTVFCVVAIPGIQINGDIAAVTLSATTHNAGTNGLIGLQTVATVGAGDIASVDIVFGDGAGDTDNQLLPDGIFSDTDACHVQVSPVTVAKAVSVLSDPINGTTNPQSIPGAILEYTITVENDAGAAQAATSITLTDLLTSELVAGTLAFVFDGYNGHGTCPSVPCGCLVTAPNINAGAALALTNILDADVGDFNGTTANAVTVGGIDLSPGELATVQFRVEIQ